MKALTVHAPWGWAIARAGKNIENRTWAPPRSILGQRIAIHQGKKFDPDAWWTFDEAGVPNAIRHRCPGIHVFGAIVATAVVAGSFDLLVKPSWERSSWAIGPVCWLLVDVVALPEPIPCKGAQGLWDIPPDIAERLAR